jgi:acetoacetyl-CoA synthetase
MAMTEHALWRPTPERVAASRLTAFVRTVEKAEGRAFDSYKELHDWSVGSVPHFWSQVWQFCGVLGEQGERVVDHLDRMPGARFFPDARLNFAENLLRRRDSAPAIIAATERGRDRQLTFGDLYRSVASAAHALRRSGVHAGDRVCGVVGNLPEAVVAALATAAIGAVWSSCSPDFGAEGIVDRFAQIEPAVLVAVDTYFYGGKQFDCRGKLAEVAGRLGTLKEIVLLQLGDEDRPSPVPGSVRTTGWNEWLSAASDALEFERFEFNHPLYVLFSSGTTGVPKCIVHGAGGTLLEHLKEHQLQSDIGGSDRVFYFTTCGWMMWNWLVSSLASGATIVLYDGSPVYPHQSALFDLADRVSITMLGVSAKFIDGSRKAGLRPKATHKLESVRTIASTGSPLPAESFDYVYDAIKSDVLLASISGGTDLIGCFVGGNPNAPVWRGEIQSAGLGLDVRVFDPAGCRVTEKPGELVCATPFPSMPIGFWNDPTGEKYQAAYFARFPGVWHHGDWIQSTCHDGFIISGRSDATLNPGGVRIGTAELYRPVDRVPEVIESLAVGQRWGNDERVILFVRLASGVVLDDDLRRRITDQIRTHTSPRHVPARIIAVGDIPRTRSGKIVELAVRQMIQGEPIQNRESLANPDSLELFRNLPELQS